MKKLAFMFVAFAAISFASCGNKTEQAAAANDSDSVACDSIAIETVDSVACCDSLSADSVAADSAAAPVAE